MSGKRLLDAAAILKASRVVALKHLRYRRYQFDTYSRTSSLARAVRNQTDRATLTLRAASALVERFNGPGSEYSTQASQSKVGQQDGSVPSPGSVQGAPTQAGSKQGLEQDHFYEKSEENTSTKPLPESDLKVEQEQAKKDPLPDGSIPQAGANSKISARTAEAGITRARTDLSPPPDHLQSDLTAGQAKKLQRQAEKQIPSESAESPPASSSSPVVSKASEKDVQELGFDQGQDVFYSPSASVGKVLSALPRVKVPKATEDVQESDPRVADEQINQDLFYSSTPKSVDAALPSAQAVPEQDGVSDDMYSEIFQSPKVAKMIKGQRSRRLDLEDTKNMPVEEKKPADEKDRVSSVGRDSLQASRASQEEPGKNTDDKSGQKLNEEDAQELGQEMAKDAQSAIEVLLTLNLRLWDRLLMTDSPLIDSKPGKC